VCGGRAAGAGVVSGRAVAGGGTAVEVAADRLTGWIARFSARNGGLVGITAEPHAITLTGGDGTTAVLEVPFAPMSIGDREPVEAVLDHIQALGEIGIVLVRGGAHSVGIAREGRVLISSTDRPYLSARTAAGGWSQRRYSRRRENQLTYALSSAADLAARVVAPAVDRLDGLALGGDRAALRRVLADDRLAALAALPSRTFPDIAEPRRAVLDAIAVRCLTIAVTVRPASAG
jgi:hypothetical protein